MIAILGAGENDHDSAHQLFNTADIRVRGAFADPEPVAWCRAGGGAWWVGVRHPRDPGAYKRIEPHPLVSSAAVQLSISPLQPSEHSAWRRYLFFPDTTYHVPKNRSHLPRYRCYLRQCLSRSGRSFPGS